MSDATKLPAEQQAAAMASISAEGLPLAIERQAAAGESSQLCSRRNVQRCIRCSCRYALHDAGLSVAQAGAAVRNSSCRKHSRCGMVWEYAGSLVKRSVLPQHAGLV
jgi:hypothetical protein